MDVSDKIRNARLAAGLTQEELARKMQVSSSMIGIYENGVRKPNLLAMPSVVRIHPPPPNNKTSWNPWGFVLYWKNPEHLGHDVYSYVERMPCPLLF